MAFINEKMFALPDFGPEYKKIHRYTRGHFSSSIGHGWTDEEFKDYGQCLRVVYKTAQGLADYYQEPIHFAVAAYPQGHPRLSRELMSATATPEGPADVTKIQILAV